MEEPLKHPPVFVVLSRSPPKAKDTIHAEEDEDGFAFPSSDISSPPSSLTSSQRLGSSDDNQEPDWIRNGVPTTTSHLPRVFVSRKELGKAIFSKPAISKTTKHIPQKSKPKLKPGAAVKQMVQMQLDLGKKRVAPVCSECGMVFSRTSKEDRDQHKKYHSMVQRGVVLTKSSLSQMNVLEHNTEDDSQIIKVVETSGKDVVKQLKELLRVVNTELGAREIEPKLHGYQAFVMIDKRHEMVGCVMCEPILEAFRSSNGALAQPSDLIKEEAVYGVNRIWVKKSHRNQGIARRLLDCMRKSVAFGCEVSKDQLAFSQPTSDGQKLAEAYCGRKDILVYHGDQ